MFGLSAIFARFAVPILTAAVILAGGLSAVQTVRITGLGFDVPFIGYVGFKGKNGEIADLDNARKDLKRQIDAPVTGWIARLTRTRANAAAFEASANTCNASVEAYKRRADDAEARGRAAQAKARAARSEAERRAGALLARQPGPDPLLSTYQLLLGAPAN